MSFFLLRGEERTLLAVHIVVYTKLRLLRLTNRIVDDSDFKQSKLEQWNPSKSKSDVQFGFWLKDDVKIHLNSTNFWLKMSKFVLFLIKMTKFVLFLIKIWLKDQKIYLNVDWKI